jgi:hypothetical protein
MTTNVTLDPPTFPVKISRRYGRAAARRIIYEIYFNERALYLSEIIPRRIDFLLTPAR